LDILSKGFSLPKNKFIEKKNFLHTEYNDTKNFSSEKDLKNISSNTILNRENSTQLQENNFYFDKNNTQMIRYPKNFFKKTPEKKNRTKVSLQAPEWFKVVTDEKNEKYDKIIAKNEETLSVFSRYNKWITVTPKSKNRRKPLEKMKIEKMDETSKIMPNWMQIKVKKDMELYGKMRSAEYNSIRHVRNFFFFIFYFLLG